MNTWLKPLITFAIGIVLGVGVMYLAGVKPTSKVILPKEISNIPGFADADFSLINNNPMLTRADIFVTVRGIIKEVGTNSILLVNGDAKPIGVILNEDAPIFEQPRQEGTTISAPKQFSFSELKPGNMVDVFGSLQGSIVIADSVLLELPPPSPGQ